MEPLSLLLGFVLVTASPQDLPGDPKAEPAGKPAEPAAKLSEAAGATRAVPLPPGIQPGDSFVLELKFSDTWEAAQVTVETGETAGSGLGPPGRPPRPLTPADLQRIRNAARSPITLSRRAGEDGPPRVTLGPSVRSIPISKDPLFVDATWRGEFLPEGRLCLTSRIARVHYFDDRGRTWTLEPQKGGAAERARTADRARAIVKENAGRWNPELSDRLEREMLEEQLLGAAIALLHEAPLEAALAERGKPASFVDLDDVFRAKLPTEFPERLLDRVRRFYGETLLRVVTPAALPPEELRDGATFEKGGVSFKVEKVFRVKEDVRVRVSGSGGDAGTGRAMRQSIVFDARTGMVIETESIFVRDTEVNSSWWVGSERWKTKLLAVKKAPKESKAP